MSTADSGAARASAAETMKVLVYSDDASTREQIRLAIGRRPAAGLPRVEFVECATEPMVFRLLDEGGIGVAVLDGEAQPAGGMGICRQAKDEIYDCPGMVVIIARRDDGWLATWSRADAVVTQPLEPVALANAVADLMRGRARSSTDISVR
jgi:DNA-binding response OmpR family regulator